VVGFGQPRVAERGVWREFPRDEIANAPRILPATAPGYTRTIFWRKTALYPDRPSNADEFRLRAVSAVLTASRRKKDSNRRRLQKLLTIRIILEDAATRPTRHGK
jgi:hypothetical protein